MILVDTSALIGFLKGSSDPASLSLDAVISRGLPYGITPLNYQEVLQGARTQKEFNRLRNYLGTLPFYSLCDDRTSYEAAAGMYRTCRKKGITIRSSLDILIAQTAIEHDLMLLHNDVDFDHIARAVKALKILKPQMLL